ncbi:Early nodulin-like protein 21, partial [Theobroma cacao]
TNVTCLPGFFFFFVTEKCPKSLANGFQTLSFSVILLFSLQHSSVSSLEFQAGGSKGWVVPPENDTKIYNECASDNRFQIGDTTRFKFRKDSVMEVVEKDYKNCNSTQPKFFSNNGNSVFTLDHAGTFYFISGASGHCERGQRMIVRVMSPQESLPTSPAADSMLGVF